MVNAPIKEADIAIVSIDYNGFRGGLNSQALKEFGYDIDNDLPSAESLKKGYEWLQHEGKNSILFIVTIDDEQTSIEKLLRKNLYKCLQTYADRFFDKTIWVAALGTGAGQLSVEVSLRTIFDVYDQLHFENLKAKGLIISLPGTSDEKVEYEVQEFVQSKNSDFIFKYIESHRQKRNVHVFSGENKDQLDDHISSRSWTNISREDLSNQVSQVKKGDIILFNTEWEEAAVAKSGLNEGEEIEEFLLLSAVGVVQRTSDAGTQLTVNWHKLIEQPRLLQRSFFSQRIQRLEGTLLTDAMINLLHTFDAFFEIIRQLDINDGIGRILRYKLDGDSKFWWINAGGKWSIDDLSVGDTQQYSAVGATGKYKSHVKNLTIHDLLIGYQSKPTSAIVGIFAITKTISEAKDRYHFELLYKFSEQTSYGDLKKMPLFRASQLAKTLQGSLISISSELFEEVVSSTEIEIPPSKDPINNDHKKAPITNDGAYTSKDLLYIENDVRSFALLLAMKEIKPPIAVSLFGKWGSGKSFFMKLLAERIDELSKHQTFLNGRKEEKVEITEKAFCEGIAQIEFNAWSYLDANLWAGLISSIFEKLDEYIKDKSAGFDEEQKIRQKLSDNLEVLSTEKQAMEKRVDELKTSQLQINAHLRKLKSDKNKALQNAKARQLQDLRATVSEEINLESLQDETKKAFDAYGFKFEEVKRINPDALYNEITSWHVFIKNFLKSSLAFKAAFGICFIAFLAFTFLPSLIDDLLDILQRQILALSSILIPIVGKAYHTFKRYKSVVQVIIDYKNRYNKRLQEAEFEYSRDLELLQSELLLKEGEINRTNDELNLIEQQLADTTESLEHFVPQKAFNNFIKSRIEGKHYEKHLGLISIIRKDFEVLSDLFSKFEVDENAEGEEKERQQKKAKDYKEFQRLFDGEKMLSRIILYIDDLDRCSDDKVLEVVQAVHLIMAFPLFNVVVGVDPRCVRNALLLKTKLEYLKIAPLEKIEYLGVEMVSPEEYLEKIFQIPFELKDPEDFAVENLVSNLLEGQVDFSVEEESSERTEQNGVDRKNQVGPKASNRTKETALSLLLQHSSTTKTVVSATPEALKLKPTEYELIKSIVFLVGTTPRTIKRFVNIYRIIRAAKRPEDQLLLDADDQLAIMFILALGIGQFKNSSRAFFEKIQDNSTEKIADIIGSVEELSILKSQLEKDENLKSVLDMTSSFFAKHFEYVGRFSFSKRE